MKRLGALLVTTVVLSGCGIVAKVNARNDMEQSKAAYKARLSQHPQDVSPCKGAKAAYEVDMQAYRATSAGIMPGRNDTLNVNMSGDEN